MYASSRALLSRFTLWQWEGIFAWARRYRALPEAVEPAVSPWISEIAEVASEIRQLNRATESDFLAVGGMLTDFLDTARQISAEISAMSESISGEAGQIACTALESILRHANRMQENAAATNNRLLEVRRLAARIGEEFSGFQQTVSTFQLVATLARIETERLGASDSELGNLSEEFRSHAASVVEGVARVLEDVSAVEKRIASTVASVSARQEEKFKELPSSIRGIESNLDAFRNRRAAAANTAESLAAQFKELSLAIAEIASSIQFHDITRQQMEHVEEVLIDWHDRAAQEAPTSDPARRERLVLQLQLAQLGSAAQLFSGSVADMDHQLQTIATRVEQMLVSQQALLELHGGNGESFFLEMQRSFEGIIEAIGDCEAMENSVRASMVDLTSVIDRLSGSSQNIRRVTIQLKWLALNTCVSAVKLGPLGEPLNIVAGNMQFLQTACETSCLGAEATIASIHDVFAAPASGSVPGARSGNDIPSDVRARTAELHSASLASTSSCQRVSATAEGLGVSIQSARKRLAIGPHVSQALERCQQKLSGLLRDFEPISEAEREQFSADFQQISKRYTMQDEREVHERIIGGGLPRQHEPASTDSATTDLSRTDADAPETSEFGDNIELF